MVSGFVARKSSGFVARRVSGLGSALMTAVMRKSTSTDFARRVSGFVGRRVSGFGSALMPGLGIALIARRVSGCRV
jgi:hypothetical protein